MWPELGGNRAHGAACLRMQAISQPGVAARRAAILRSRWESVDSFTPRRAGPRRGIAKGRANHHLNGSRSGSFFCTRRARPCILPTRDFSAMQHEFVLDAGFVSDHITAAAGTFGTRSAGTEIGGAGVDKA